MNFIWPAKFSHERFEAMYRIYVESIPAAERKPDWMIRQMWDRPDYAFGLAEIEDQIVGFSILFIGDGPTANAADFYLLEYFAIDSHYRNRGVGSQLFQQTVDAAYQHHGPVPLLIEVESDRINSPDQPLIRKRIEFYRRLGCRQIVGLDYRLPLKWPVPPMELMVRTSGDSISTVTLRRWIETIYSRVYRRDANDPRIDQMFASATDQFALE